APPLIALACGAIATASWAIAHYALHGHGQEAAPAIAYIAGIYIWLLSDWTRSREEREHDGSSAYRTAKPRSGCSGTADAVRRRDALHAGPSGPHPSYYVRKNPPGGQRRLTATKMPRSSLSRKPLQTAIALLRPSIP